MIVFPLATHEEAALLESESLDRERRERRAPHLFPTMAAGVERRETGRATYERGRRRASEAESGNSSGSGPRARPCLTSSPSLAGRRTTLQTLPIPTSYEKMLAIDLKHYKSRLDR